MNPRQHILIIDDEENLRHMLTVMLTRQGYGVDSAGNGSEGLEKAGSHGYDYILCDIRMPEMDGKQFLVAALDRHVTAPVIMMSAYGTVDTAVECMKLGAYDFISKPFKKDEIIMVLRKAEERERLKQENSRLRQEMAGRFGFCGIISRNAGMEAVFGQIDKVADLRTTVLVQGESGTGKELVARAVHAGSSRSAAPFIAVNCGAIPENLLESELFGHVRGAFTDATSDKAGLFEQADQGTLFLDEIGDMPLSLQVKLLRVLQDGEIRRIGAASSSRVDVRVVSATSRNLLERVAQGAFREDLYFRLNVFQISLPPLRDRVDDIPLLAEHFLAASCQQARRDVPAITPEAMRCLMAYRWPGNVRELQNVMERASILCDGRQVRCEHLPETLHAGDGPAVAADEDLSIKRAEAAMERDLIRRALQRTGGNRTQAAKILEISHRSLLYKLKEFGIE